LIHHTNHQGYFILPEAAGPHFPLPVIWTQAVWRSKTTNEEPAQTQQRDDDSAAIEQTTQHNSTYNHNHNNKQQQQQQQQLLVGCCPHVGRRSIRIVNSDFPSCHDDDEWFLFCVQVVSNSSNNSIYYKFAVSPSENNNNNNINNNSNTISNTILATTGGVSLRPECLLEDLEYYLTLFREQHIAGHIHVGLVIDTLRAPLTSLSSICDYRAACLQDLVACEDEAILDMWLQRAQQQQQTKTKIEKQQQQQDSSAAATTIWQPTPFSSDIPKTIVVAGESSFYKNLRGV
jgi:hypothetical protein